MGIVGRILMMIVAYLLACIAASIVLTFGTLTPEWESLNSLGVPPGAVWLAVAIGAAIIFAVAMLPALLVIALAEGFAWRSVLVYGALGGMLSLALCYGMDFSGYASEPNTFLVRQREVLAASGIVGGFVYWLFAGRGAGSWKR